MAVAEKKFHKKSRGAVGPGGGFQRPLCWSWRLLW